MKIQEFLEKVGEMAELDSHRNTPDAKYKVLVSAFTREISKLDKLIELIDEVYELKQEGEEYTLVKKNEN